MRYEFPVALFCAGYRGRLAVNYFGKENIICFIDNNSDKFREGKQDGISVLGLKEYKSLYGVSGQIVVANMKPTEILSQIKTEGFENVKLFFPEYWPDFFYKNLKDNMGQKLYACDEKSKSEEEIIAEKQYIYERNIEYYNQYCKYLYDNGNTRIRHISIETLNRCNGSCDFCPANVKNEKRSFLKMDDKLFRRIIDELAEMEYDGGIELFGNNEPLIDDRIVELYRYIEKKLPRAFSHIYTNGILLNINLFLELIDIVDFMLIDNYNERLQLGENIKGVIDYCEKHPQIAKKIHIDIINPHAIRSTRGG